MATFNINSYQIDYSSNTSARRIVLYYEGKTMGQLCFLPAGTALPHDSTISGQFIMFYHVEDIANIIHLLETNKTLLVTFTGTQGDNVFVVPTKVTGT